MFTDDNFPVISICETRGNIDMKNDTKIKEIFGELWKETFDKSVINWLKHGKSVALLKQEIDVYFNYTMNINLEKISNQEIDDDWIIAYNPLLGPCLSYRIKNSKTKNR